MAKTVDARFQQEFGTHIFNFVRGYFTRLHRRRLLPFGRYYRRCEFDCHQVGNSEFQES